MNKKKGQNPRPKSFADVVGQAGNSSTPARAIEQAEDGSLLMEYHHSKYDIQFRIPDPGDVSFAANSFERAFLSEDERAWLRIVDALDLAMLNPGITNNAHAAEFCSMVRQLALSARGSSTIDQVLAPLKVAAKSLHSSDAASRKNEAERAWVLNKWNERTDLGQSKQSFSRQYSSLVKAKFGLDITPDHIARYWLPKGKPTR